MGHSAGAGIGALLHYDESYLQIAGTQRRPCGFIGLSGAYDFLPLAGGPFEQIFPKTSREIPPSWQSWLPQQVVRRSWS